MYVTKCNMCKKVIPAREGYERIKILESNHKAYYGLNTILICTSCGYKFLPEYRLKGDR